MAKTRHNAQMELLERDQQLGALSALLRDVEAGEGRLALVAGDAGAGKSALVHRFCESMPEPRDAMWGMCDPLSTPRPLGPLIDIAPQLGDGIGELLSSGQREGLFEATRAALAARRMPGVAVFEDLHWADDATLDLLRFLGRRLRTSRVLIVGTYRQDEVGPDHPLRILLGDLAPLDYVHRLSVPALSLTAVATLARGTAMDPATLHRETGGNAFFVTEVLSDGDGGLPATVADAVLTRVARLTAPARRTLEAAAIAGPRIDPAVLMQMRDVDPDGLDECMTSGLLQEVPLQYEFKHELARQAVLAAVTPRRRASLHSEVLAILLRKADRTSQLDRLAHHAESAGDAEATLEFAPAAAAVAASLKSHRAAAAHYRKAVPHAGLLPPRERAALFERASYEEMLIDHLADARSLAERAIETWRELGDQRKVGDLLRWLSRVFWLSGMTPKAHETATEAISILERLPPGRELAMAYSNSAQLCMVAQRANETEMWGTKALALARGLEDAQIAAHALNNLGSSRLRRGDLRGREQLLESLRLSVDAGLEDDAARAWTNLAAALASQNEVAEATRYAEDGFKYCVEHDLEGSRMCLGANLAFLYMRSGRWDDALALATASSRDGQLSRVTRLEFQTIVARVRTRRGEGDPTGVLDQAWKDAWAAGDLQFVAMVAVARAEASWFAGRPDDIPRELARPLAMALEAGDAERIGELSFWMWKAGSLSTPIDGASRPYALQIRGDWRAAYEAWAETGCPYEAALALADSDQEEDLRAAITALTKLGAKPAIAEVTRRMRSLGATSIPRGPRPRTRENPAGLTAREMDILSLLSDGLRNPDIARRLFLSQKTVDHHVSAILAKLEVRTRSEAAQRARELVAAGSQR